MNKENLEIIIEKDSEKLIKPFSISIGDLSYNNLSLDFLTSVAILFLKMDYNLSIIEIENFPYTYRNLSKEDISIFKNHLKQSISIPKIENTTKERYSYY